jgi:hypothetical protein
MHGKLPLTDFDTDMHGNILETKRAEFLFLSDNKVWTVSPDYLEKRVCDTDLFHVI